MSWWSFRLHYWPRLTAGWFILTFTISYITALSKGHIYELFPYISDTGAIPPESSIFGQMMNIGALFMAVTMYIRYRQVDFAIRSEDIPLKKTWNTFGFWTGNVVCFGVSMVGNFQKPSTPMFHFLGAFLAFGIAVIYLFIQTRITFAYSTYYGKYPEYEIGKKMLYLRVVLTILYIIIFIIVVVCGTISARKVPENKSTFKWTESTDGYPFHLTATISEWVVFLLFIGYTLTGTAEFKTLNYEEIRFKRVRSNVKA